jgi:hypothetical protein
MVIVSKDSDFRQRSFLLGAPPKVVFIGLGNCSTLAIEETLKRHLAEMEQFEADPGAVYGYRPITMVVCLSLIDKQARLAKLRAARSFTMGRGSESPEDGRS